MTELDRPGDHRPGRARRGPPRPALSSTTTSPAWASARRTGSRSSSRSTRSASTSPSTPTPKAGAGRHDRARLARRRPISSSRSGTRARPSIPVRKKNPDLRL
ncbi:MAG: hypothetical protein M0C28_21200 [Candidatus Moduliflexus flocculans]|nr:hypothetical protein [Candidatus Moduliflexus flocculans]